MEWFANWFDSPYYHLLYNKRNDDEAQLFMRNLTAHLAPVEHARIWDLACGKGRHSIYLASLGYEVIGVDLSANSIKAAREHESEHLHFYEHDMRRAFYINYFDYVFNLFTSFGYFKTEREHLQALQHAYNALKPNGVFVMDFMNSVKVVNTLQATHQEVRGDIVFDIQKVYENGKIIKTIKFSDAGQAYFYQEQVRAFTSDELAAMLTKVGFKVKALFGNYNLDAFDANTSDRTIIIVEK